MAAKASAVAGYASQMSTFWANEEAMIDALRQQARRSGGERLWARSV
jgi:hypothetical protein